MKGQLITKKIVSKKKLRIRRRRKKKTQILESPERSSPGSSSGFRFICVFLRIGQRKPVYKKTHGFKDCKFLDKLDNFLLRNKNPTFFLRLKEEETKTQLF